MSLFYRNKLSLILALGLCTAHTSTFANQTAPAHTDEALSNLARAFVKKLDPFYSNVKKSERDSLLSSVPDDTTLLLKPQIDRFSYPGDIYSFKKDGRIFLSITDVIDVLDLAIDFDEDSKTGKGWFLREDWPISIDLENNTVNSRGKSFRISNQDVIVQDGILFVTGNAITSWTDIAFEYDLSQQYVYIDSTYPLPAIAQNSRRDRKASLRRNKNETTLPRIEEEEKILDFDVADINAGIRYNKTAAGNSRNQNFTNVAVQGQFLNHDAYALAARNSDYGLTSITSRLSKRSEDPTLLGPLKARAYALGDVGSTEIPLTGTSTQNLGFRVDNNPLTNTDFNTTRIQGDATPGWDTELYRNGVLVDSLVIGDDGRYEFSSVPLFAGDNEFEVFFYGPQGEIRREAVDIPVTADLLQTQQDTYELSVNLEEERTYQNSELKAEDPDEGQIHIAGRYNKFIGNSLGYLGFRSRPIEGERKTFLSTGLTSVLNETIVDSNFAIDDEANTAVELKARRKLADWNLSLGGQWNSDEYTPSETTDPTVLNLNTSAQRTFDPFPGHRLNVLTSAGYRESAAGTSFTRARFGLSDQIGNINLSNNLLYEKAKGSSAPDEELQNSFAVRGNVGKTFLRAGVDYDIKPVSQVDRYFTQINYRPDQYKNADLRLEHEPDRDFSRGRLNLNYTHDYFRTSPFLEVTSEDEVFAGVNVNFSVLDKPGQVLPEITSKRLVGKGLVSGFVYHDKNGNHAFDEGLDEPLPEVSLVSLNSKKREMTNDKGYAMLKAMPTTRPTDIVIDEDTLPDSFMVSGFPGLSVIPTAGKTHHIDFPVHLAGEIDGTLYTIDKFGNKKTYSNKVMELVSLDNPERKKQTAKAAFDGFYLFVKVPPGKYMMYPKQRRSDDNLGNTTPQFVHIGYDGTTLFGQDINFSKDDGFVPYTVEFIDKNAKKHSTQLNYVLRVKKTGKTQLSSLLNKLLLKTYAYPVLSKLNKLHNSSNDEFDYYSADISKLHNSCSALQSHSMSCEMVISVSPLKDV